MALRDWTMLAAGTALLGLGGVAAAQASPDTTLRPPAPPEPRAAHEAPAAPEAPTQPEAPLVDRAEIDREVAQGLAEARESIAEARKEIAAAREEILREKGLPASVRTQALASLDRADRDIERALSRQRD